jgi:hypothetical protein
MRINVMFVDNHFTRANGPALDFAQKKKKLHTHAVNLQLDELKEELNSLQEEVKLSWMSSEFYTSLLN